MIYTVLISILIAVFVLISLFRESAAKRFAVKFCFAVLILLFCLRGSFGTDWVNYKMYYENINDASVVADRDFEYGFFLLNLLFSNLGFSYWFFNFIYSLILSWIFICAIKRTKGRIEYYIIPALIYFYYPSMEALRQAMALSLFLLSLTYSRKAHIYFLLNIIGFLFHRTCIFAILFYFIYKYRTIRVSFVIGVLLYMIFKPDLSFIFEPLGLLPKYKHYSFYAKTYESWTDIISIKLIEYIVIYILYLKIKKKNKFDKVVFTLLGTGIFIQMVLPFVIDASYRLMYYTDMGLILAYGNLLNRCIKKSTRNICMIMMGGYVFLRFYRIISLNPQIFEVGKKI